MFGMTKTYVEATVNVNFSGVDTMKNIWMLREVVDFKLEVKFTDCKWVCRLGKFIKLVSKQSLLPTCQSNTIREIVLRTQEVKR